jgi:HK97 family phage prohead protease
MSYKKKKDKRELPDNYRPATADDVPEGRACGNCRFFNEDDVNDEGEARCTLWDEYVAGGNYCNSWEPREDDAERAQTDLKLSEHIVPSATLRAVARRAGVAAVSAGNMTPALWVEVRDALKDGSTLWGFDLALNVKGRLFVEADVALARLEEENEGRTVTGEAKLKLETRILDVDTFEVREDSDGMHLEGYAAVFNSRSENLGGFTETIAPGAFRSSLRSRNDIKLLWNHDSGAVLGSTRAGTLSLTEDDKGLRVSATLPNTTHGRDASELIRRGDVTAFSFGFSLPGRGGDSWSDDGTERVLKSVRLHEVSLVAFPAYPGTAGSATVRGLDRLAKRANVDADALADALLKLEQGEEITADDRAIVDRVLDELAPQQAEETVDENTVDAGMLALKKKKLELLMKGI